MTEAVAGNGIAYLDSSAVVKLAIDEPESESLRALIAAWPHRSSSELTITEVLRGVRRSRSLGAEAPARRLLSTMAFTPLRKELLFAAGSLLPLALRSLDAIHVVTASVVGAELFISYDKRLLAAASASGLDVASPA